MILWIIFGLPFLILTTNKIAYNETLIVKLPKLKELKNVTVTVYNPVKGQTDDTPYLTAYQYHIPKDLNVKWVEISPDLLRWVNEGDSLLLDSLGKYKVVGVTNKKLKRTVDILSHKTRGKWLLTVKILKQ